MAADTSSTSNLCHDLREERKYHNKLYLSCRENSNGDAIYKVTTIVTFEVPLIGIDLDLEINNETKALYGVNCVIQNTRENPLQACR